MLETDIIDLNPNENVIVLSFNFEMKIKTTLF